MARPWSRKIALAVIILLIAVAALANFLAADKPLLLRWQGRTYVLPNIIAYDTLTGLSAATLRQRMDERDWALWPPIVHDPRAVRTAGTIAPVKPPSAQHWLGTDDRGRDVLARLIHGTRTTVITAAGAALLALALGLLLALIAIVCRQSTRALKPIDPAVAALCDAIAALPALIIVVAAQGLIGRASLIMAVVLIALPRAADTARIARGVMIATLAQPYCQAARALGASRLRVIGRHALPQAMPHVAVATAITAATAVLAEAALSFLGFGTPPPAASWGELLKQAHENGLRWHLVVPAGVAVAMAAAALGALAQPGPHSDLG